MKRKWVKIGVIILSVLAAVLLILALSISPIVKHYIEKNSKELIGRQVLMSSLHINIFTGSVEADSLRMYEATGNAVFASIDTFYIKITFHKLLGSTFELSEMKVIKPYVVILQNKDQFNFDDLMARFNKKDSTKSSFPKSIVLKNIFIKGGRIIYTDQQLHNTIKMNDLGVAIPELRFGQGNTNAGIHLKIGNNATVDSQLTLNMQTNQYQWDLQIGNLPINIFYPYAKEKLNIAKLDGFLNTNLHLNGDMAHMMNFVVTGTANMKSFNVTNSTGEELMSAATADAKINKIIWNSSTYLFDYLHASGVSLNFILKPTTNNYSGILKPEQPEDTTSSAMTVKINDLHITNSQVTYTDKTLVAPFILPMRNVDFQATNFDMNGENNFKIKALFPEGGIAQLTWKGNFDDYSNQQIMLNMQNISLRLFTPYCLYYTAYPITTGNMNYISKNIIRQNNINSTNLIDIYKTNVGKKQAGLKPQYHVPMKLALYILKDKDGKIQLDVPVKGNIHDPKFSYSKIIIKTLVNLMVKIAVSPVRFLANSLGLNPNTMDAIMINPLQSDFTAEQYQQLNNLANMMKQKPDMLLSLTQYANLKTLLPDYMLYKTKEAYLLSQRKDTTLHHLRYSDVELVRNNDAGFEAYLDTLVKTKATIAPNASLQEKIAGLYVPDSIQASTQRLLQRRNLFLQNYMTTSLDVPAKNLVVKTADKAMLDSYTRKAMYKIEMTLPGADNTADTTQLTK